MKIIRPSNLEYIKTKEEINELVKSIKEIKDNDYPFNPNCECCKAQPWKLLLIDNEKKFDKLEKE